MYAKIELDNDVLEFINKIQNHTETFEEIQELVFTKKRLNQQCSAIEMVNLSLQFQEIKRSAISKILNQEKLNFPEGFLIERLVAKYNNEDYIPVEEHFEQISKNCSTDRNSKRKNERSLQKLYNNFIEKICNKEKIIIEKGEK